MVGLITGIIAACIYIYPVFLGLILLPLDLLVSNSAPWLLANQILIKNSYMLDSIIQMYPWHRLTFESLTKGIIPLWNPYQIAGMPFMAGLKPMVFYPLNLLFIFGEIPSWNMLMFFQLFLAFFFCYLLMRKLRVFVWGSLLASVAFAYSSLMVGFLQFGSDGHTLIWLPLLCWCLFSYADSKKGRYLFGLGIGVACSVFAGHLQMAAYEFGLIAVLILYLYRIKQASKKDVFMICLALAAGLGIASVQLLPSIELFSLSARGTGLTQTLFAEGLIRPYQLLRIFSPDMFGHPATGELRIGYIETSGYFGLVPLFFTFFAVLRRKDNVIVKFFFIVCVLSVVFSMWPLGLLISFLRIPVLTSGSGGRLFFLALFSGAVLAGYGLDIFIRDQDNKMKLRSAIFYCIGVILLILIAYLSSTYIGYYGATFRNLKFSIAVITGLSVIFLFYFLLRKKYRFIDVIFLICVLMVSYVDLFRMGYRFLTFSNSKFFYPEIPVIQFVKEKTKDTLGRTYGLTGSEVPTALRIQSIETYNPLYPKRTATVLKALEGKEDRDYPTNVFRFENSKRLKYVLDFLGVSYIATENDKNPALTYLRSIEFQNDFTKVYTDERHDVYQNTKAYPRFGLFYDAVSGLSEDSILTDIRNKKTDLSKTVLLEERLTDVLTSGTGSAKLISWDVNTEAFAVTTDVPALFYISDALMPGWKATINGKTTHVYRANYAFRSVIVPKGESTVVFAYKPSTFRVGIVMSGTSLFFLCCIGFISFSFAKKAGKKKER